MSRRQRSEAQAFYERRVEQQAGPGVDLFILETFYSVEEACLAIPFVKQAGVPAVVTMTYRDVALTKEGHAPQEAAQRLVDGGADVVGVNCMRPWQTMWPLVRDIRKAVSVPVCAQPTAYQLEPGEVYNRPLNGNIWTQVEPRVLTRFTMAEYAIETRGIGVNLIGSCCGSLPYHVRAMAEALGKTTGLPDLERAYRGKAS